jgi:hypothetical protein
VLLLGCGWITIENTNSHINKNKTPPKERRGVKNK